MGFLSCKSLLHVGCGGDVLPDWIRCEKETRLDISPINKPDIVADMTAMGEIGTYDAVYCCHALEHLPCYMVPVALSEFKRILNDGGSAVVLVPDLEGVEATEEVILESPAGGITGLDMIYGFRKVLKEMPYMAHQTGFVQSTLFNEMDKAGFSRIAVNRIGNYNLMGVGIK